MSSALFQPLALRGVSLPNRIVVSPMCQYSARDGNASDWHLGHYLQLASGSPGLLCLEATAVEAVGRITPGCLGLWSDENEAALGRVVDAIRRHADTPLAIQLGHSGRKGSSRAPWEGGTPIAPGQDGWQTIAPSGLPHAPGQDTAPLEMRPADLARVREAFVQSTRRAARLGLEAIELHAAHGYLLHQFLSPVSNRRSDAYGGTLENRMRFPLEVFEQVRAAWPADRPLGVRISVTDWVEGGWDLAQSVEFASRLKEMGCDWIDASSGGVSTQQKIALGPDYQVPFATEIRRQARIAVMAVGLITQPGHAEAIVAEGKADLVAIGRAMLYDPRWPWHAAAELGAQVSAPRQYWRAAPRGARGLFGDTSFVLR